MSDKQYSPEEVLNLQSAAYQKGYNEGYQLGRYEEAQQVAVWVKVSERLPDHYKLRFKDKHGNEFNGNYSKESGQYYAYGFPCAVHDVVEWKDEQATTSSNWVNAEIKPEYNKGVLVFIPGEDNHITSGMWDISNKWVLLDEYRTPEEEVTHWMELPSLPNGYTDNELPKEIIVALKEIAKKELPKMKEQEIEWLDEQATASNKDEAVEFAEWVRDNTVPDGAPKLFYKPDISRYTIRQLYELWQQSKNKQ